MNFVQHPWIVAIQPKGHITAAVRGFPTEGEAKMYAEATKRLCPFTIQVIRNACI